MSSTLEKIYSYNIGGNPITTIGIDQNGQFVVKTLTKLTTLKESKDYIALLTIV